MLIRVCLCLCWLLSGMRKVCCKKYCFCVCMHAQKARMPVFALDAGIRSLIVLDVFCMHKIGGLAELFSGSSSRPADA